MSFVFNSSKIFLLIIIVPIIFIDSKITSIGAQSFINEEVVAEGIVTHIYSAQTPEISYHSGYVLKNPYWIVRPREQKSHVFLKPSSLVKNFQDKKVHVEGLFTQIPGKEINDYTFIASYYVIMIDTIYCIE